MQKLKNPFRMLLIALLVAWCFDLLTWRKVPGVSFFIFVSLCLAGGWLATRWEGLKPALSSLALILPILFFAAIFFIRRETFTQATAFLLTLGGMAILALTWRGGKWLHYSLSDYGLGFIHLGINALILPVMMVFSRFKTPKSESIAVSDPERSSTPGVVQTNKGISRTLLFSILRGLLLAIPVLAVLTALLASADPIFSGFLNASLKLFRIENLGEYIFRMIYILVGAFLLVGIYLHALARSQEENLIGVEQPWLKPFLGFAEALIVLCSVDLLFALFVGIQFRYFFGGQANIHLQGYTYAEYARRGFGELVVVSGLSLVLFLGLAALTQRKAGRQRNLFTGLGVGLVALVAVILGSAFQRLTLYEMAYGFTEIRTVVHVFMIWLGILLVLTVGVELRDYLRGFALAVVIASLGFGVSLSLLNVDGFIVNRNVVRAQAGEKLDAAYLSSLSEDSIPVLAANFQRPDLSPGIKDDLGGVLACQKVTQRLLNRPLKWQEFNFSVWFAKNALQGLNLGAYPVYSDQGSHYVMVNGQKEDCDRVRGID